MRVAKCRASKAHNQITLASEAILSDYTDALADVAVANAREREREREPDCRHTQLGERLSVHV